MRTVSSYGVELRKQNIPIRQTLDIYRSAVSCLIEIYAQIWDELAVITEPKKRFNTAEPVSYTHLKQINIVMKSLIPEINIEIYNAFDKLLKDGKDGVQFEIIAMRGENRIPLLYESAGIKKLISICSNLVACYNRESYCLVVDELDSSKMCIRDRGKLCRLS